MTVGTNGPEAIILLLGNVRRDEAAKPDETTWQKLLGFAAINDEASVFAAHMVPMPSDEPTFIANLNLSAGIRHQPVFVLAI
jgi:hypothetical protein